MKHATLSIGTNQVKVLTARPRSPGGLPWVTAIDLQSDSANTVTIYLGSSGVTADTTPTGGFALGPGQSLPMLVADNEQLFAIVASSTAFLRILVMDGGNIGDIGL